VTTDSDANPAPGWYQDPYGTPAWRYWDGSQWTDHVAPWTAREPSPAERVADERRWARYAKWAFAALVPFQIGAQVVGAWQYDRVYGGRLFADNAPDQVNLFDPAWAGTALTLCALGGLAAILVLGYWCMQAARAAQAQGIQIVRSPGLAMAGWIIPIINLWWPPQAIRSFAKDRDALRHVVGWWICYIVSVLASIGATIVAGTNDFGAAIPFLVVGATSILSFALLGVQVVDMVLHLHEQGVPAAEQG